MGVRGETLPCMIILRFYGGHPDHSETKEAGSSGCLMYRVLVKHFAMGSDSAYDHLSIPPRAHAIEQTSTTTVA